MILRKKTDTGKMLRVGENRRTHRDFNEKTKKNEVEKPIDQKVKMRKINTSLKL